MANDTTSADANRPGDAELVPLLLANQARLYSFIVSMVPNRADAEDLFQETGLVLHRRFDEFLPGTSFLNWACQIAYHKVLDLRKRQSRSPLLFNTEFVEAIAEHQLSHNDELSARQSALSKCLEKLPPKDRQLVEQCYHRGATVKSVAERLRRPVDSIYKRLSQIRGLLFNCVTREIAKEGRP